MEGREVYLPELLLPTGIEVQAAISMFFRNCQMLQSRIKRLRLRMTEMTELSFQLEVVESHRSPTTDDYKSLEAKTQHHFLCIVF